MSAGNFQQMHTAGAEAAVNAEPTSSTTMVSDADVVMAKQQNTVALPKQLLSGASSGFSQDVHSFLAKPLLLYSSTLATTDHHRVASFPNLLRNFLARDIYQSKVKGWMAIRATIVIRIQFNANRFLQGRYILAFLPLVGSLYGNSHVRRSQLLFSPTQVTQLPHVEFDLNTDTEAVLEIPYISPYSHYNIVDGTGDVGELVLYAYSHISAGPGAETTAQYSLWMSLKDVELVTPTLPQMDLAYDEFEFQSDMRVKSRRVKKSGNVIETEQESVGVGPLQGTLQKVAALTSKMSTIPLISSIAAPVSWATDISAQLAGVFGWSKPINLEHVQRVITTSMPYANNCDAVDNSMQLALFSKNQVEVMPGFAGTDVDEMSIDYVKKIPAFVYSFNWNNNQQAGTNLFFSRLRPDMNTSIYDTPAGRAHCFTPMGFLFTMFGYYRGSIRLTFKIVKTEFHTGRLLFCYVPKTENPPHGPISQLTLDQSNYLHREIIDIRNGNEFSFVCPWANTSPYLDFLSSYGRVYLLVLNELSCPATVHSEVEILVEVSAADDMEFACPRKVEWTPTTFIDTQMDLKYDAFEFQMDSSMIINETVGGGRILDDGLTNSRFCIGEKVMSLSSLLKRSFCAIGGLPMSSEKIWYSPYAIMQRTTSTTSTLYPEFGTDMYSYISSCYALSRGGVRIKGYLVGTARRTFVSLTRFKSSVKAQGMFYDDVDAKLWNGGLPDNSLGVIVDWSKGDLEVQVPNYCRFPVRVNSELISNSVDGLETIYDSASSVALLMINDQLQGRIDYARSVADEFQLGYFIGVPPMTLADQ